MKKTLLLTLILILVFTNVSYCLDIEENINSALIGDFETGQILYSFNIDNPVSIASITKLMTYLVTMDAIRDGKVNLNDIVIIGENPPKEWGNSFYLMKGEKIKLSTLISSMLIASANDSCVAIAEYVAGSEEEFVKLMNNKANQIGLKFASFINANGLPEENRENTMSAKDIFILARHILNTYPEILNITSQKKIEIPERRYTKESTNPLLNVFNQIDGLKTGYTTEAGYCLVSTAKIDNKLNSKPFRLIGIVMGADSKKDRKNKSTELIKWGMDNFRKRDICYRGQCVGQISLIDGEKSKVNIYPERDGSYLLKNDDVITKKIFLEYVYKAPIYKGQKIGRIEIYKNDKKFDQINLIVKERVNKASFFTRFYKYLYNQKYECKYLDLTK